MPEENYLNEEVIENTYLFVNYSFKDSVLKVGRTQHFPMKPFVSPSRHHSTDSTLFCTCYSKRYASLKAEEMLRRLIGKEKEVPEYVIKDLADIRP